MVGIGKWWRPFRSVHMTCGILLAGLFVSFSPSKPAALAQDAKPEEPPEPEVVTLETKDFVKLKATYYGGIHKEKTVPIIMVHDFKGSRLQFNALALGLQKTRGHAILAIDLRGHGDSTTRLNRQGKEEKFTPDDLKPLDYAAMIEMDLEAAKAYLRDKNNKKELNIEQLCVIGAGPMGSLVALNWTLKDWLWKSTPFLKQGQDVKAMVLLSPARTFKNLNSTKPLANDIVAGRLSVMAIANDKDAEFKQIRNQFERKHAPIPETAEERRKSQDIFMITEETELKGIALLHPNLPTARNIQLFIDRRLVEKADEFPWKDRTRPGE